MKDERQKNNVYTEAEVRKYQELVNEKNAAQERMSDQSAKAQVANDQLKKCKSILSEAPKRIIQCGWKFIWHGIFVKINADPITSEVRKETHWLNSYWEAKDNIVRLRKEVDAQHDLKSKAVARCNEATRKVNMYLELFPGIDSVQLPAETGEKKES